MFRISELQFDELFLLYSIFIRKRILFETYLIQVLNFAFFVVVFDTQDVFFFFAPIFIGRCLHITSLKSFVLIAMHKEQQKIEIEFIFIH